MRRWSSWLSLAILGLVAWLEAAPARACTTAVVTPFRTDASLSARDREPPSRPRIESVDVYRHKDLGTCGSFGVISIELVDVSDDLTSIPELGYEVRIQAGNAPERVRQVDGQAQAFGSSRLWFHTGFEEVKGVDFELTVTLVDKAGNRGEPSEAARAVFSGCTKHGSDDDCGGGCIAAGGTPPVAGLLLLAVGIAVVAIRLRGRRGH